MSIVDTIGELEQYVEEPPKPLDEMTIEERWNWEMKSQGWLLARFDEWLNDTIVIAADNQVSGYPEGYAVYTLKELDMLWFDRGHPVQDGGSMHLVHTAKKLAGAVIVSIVRRNR